LMFVLLVLEWVLGVPLVLAFAFNGIAFSLLFLSRLFYLVYRRVLHSESVNISVFRNIRASLFSAIVAGLAAKLLMSVLTESPLTLAGAALAASAVYLAGVWALEKRVLAEFRENFLEISGAGGER